MPDVLKLALIAGSLLLSPLGAQAIEERALEEPAAEDEASETARITGEEALTALVADRTQYGDRSDGLSDIEFHSGDGRSAYWYDGCLYRGVWWATEDALCYIYPTTTWPGPHCFTVERRDGQLTFVGSPGGPDALVISITANVPGNPENFPLDGEGNCDLISALPNAG